MKLVRFFLGLIGFFLSLNVSATTDMDLIGQKVPAFGLPTITNSSATLNSKLLCGRVSLLNVWSSWCYACRYEHATLMHIRQTTNIPIYGINYEDKPANAISWLDKAGNPYALIGMDADGTVAEQLGAYGLPETYVIDANGIIRYSFRGSITPQTWQTVLLPVVAKYVAEAGKTKPNC